MSGRPRYLVRAVDNCGTLDPAPPRDRTWDVVDRETGDVVFSTLPTRADARAEARALNERLEMCSEDPRWQR